MKLINDEWITKDECFDKHFKLIHESVQKFKTLGTKSGLDYDDLFQIGAVGLILAYDRFEAERGFRFSTYAKPVIQGTVYRELRDKGRLVKHTRNSFQISSHIHKQGLQDESVTTIMNHFNIKRDLAREALEVTKGSTTSLQKETIDGLDIESLLGAEDDTSYLYIEDFVNMLSDRDKHLLSLKLQKKTQREISEQIGVSQVQVSRDLHKIGKRLQMYNNL